MVNSTSFTGIYLVNSPSAKKVDQTVDRIKQECQSKQIDCDSFVFSEMNNNKQIAVFTEKDAESCRQNKDEYMTYTKKVREIVKNTPDDINAQMSQMPKMTASLTKFVSKISEAMIGIPELEDNTTAINKDLDEGTFNVAQGKGPNLTIELDKVFKEAVDKIIDWINK